MLKKYIPFIFLLISSSIFAQTNAIPERPNPPRLVNNFSSSNFISHEEQSLLEQKLQTFANLTSNQIVIVIIDDIGEQEPWEFATELGRKWGIGQKKENNGIVILVKPTGGKGQRYLEIAVGLGLEGAIPDITTKMISEKEMNPYFKAGQGYTGLDKGTDVLMALAKGEYNSAEYAKRNAAGGKNEFKLILLFAVIIIVLIVSANKKRGGGGGMSMGTGFLLGSLFSNRGGGGGFGGGSGGGGGGFGGFGGGSFGGGGASSSW